MMGRKYDVIEGSTETLIGGGSEGIFSGEECSGHREITRPKGISKGVTGTETI